MPYKGGGYKRKGVLYEGPTLPRGRKPKAVVIATSSAPTTSVSSKVKDYVKKAISKETETKYAQSNIFNQQNTIGYGLNNTIVNPLGLTTTVSIVPPVFQGATEDGRIGNKIQCKGLYVKFALRAIDVSYLGSNDNPFTPFMARVIIYSKKISKSDYSNIGILNSGAASSNLGSAPETWLEPYNTDAFNIHYSKQFQMVPARRATNQTTPNQWAQDAVVDKARSFVLKKVKLKNIPKSFIYDDATNGSRPQNVACYMAVCVCNENGTGNNMTNDQRLMVNADAQLYYKDA